MKAHTLTHQQRTKSPPGFASLLTVVSVGIGLLIIMISMYQNTVESQSVQKNNLLKNDYMQREEAFLRALTNIIPNHAMLCMQDGSSEGYWWGSNQSLRWNAIFDTAMAQSNSESAVSDSVAESLGIGGRRSGNVANTSLNSNTVIRPLSGADLWDVTSGTNLEATTSFPPPLECSEYNKFLDRLYPIISHKKIYGSSATGWVQAPVDEYPLYNLVEAPKLHFHYTNSPTLIAKHNWWAFELSFADQDKSNTKLTGRKKKIPHLTL